MNTLNEMAEKAFKELNESLKAEDITLTVICAGGFVLSQYGIRTTRDIDGFYQSSFAIEKAIKEVGDKLGLNTEDELWLNNSVMNLNRTPKEDICNAFCEFSNLKVLLAPLKYVAGMKLKSAREKDLDDVAEIVKVLKTEDPLGFSDDLSEMGFSIDDSLTLEAFGTAYGMDWLQKYFENHEEDILKRL